MFLHTKYCELTGSSFHRGNEAMSTEVTFDSDVRHRSGFPVPANTKIYFPKSILPKYFYVNLFNLFHHNFCLPSFYPSCTRNSGL